MIRTSLLLAILALGAAPKSFGRNPIIPSADGFEARDRAAVLRFTPDGLRASLVDRATKRVWGLHWSVDGARSVTPRGAGSCGVVHEIGRRTGIPAVSKVIYDGIFDGVALEVEKRALGFKYTVLCDAGVDASALRFRYDGVSAMESADGLSLSMATGLGPMREDGLAVWQGSKRIAARFADIRHEGGLVWTYRIALGDHDGSLPLVIDPTVTYAIYVGGSEIDGDGSMTADSAGNAFVGCFVASGDMTTTGGFDPMLSGSTDAYLAKYDTTGALVWGSYFGGTGDENLSGICLDASGNIAVVGQTNSADFPTVNPFQAALAGGWDVMLATIASDGASIVWSSYYGTAGLENPMGGLALDGAGNFCIGGLIQAANLPGASAGFDPTYSSTPDGFVARIATSGPIWASYVGGTSTDDQVQAVAADAAGNVFIAGVTSTTFPTTAGAFQTAVAGGRDGFVIKVNAAGTLAWSTCLGGSADESLFACTLDSAGNVVVGGMTQSANYPTQSPSQAALSGVQDGVITKIAPGGASLVWSTFSGGTGAENVRRIALQANALYAAGITTSTDLPSSGDGFQTASGGSLDGFVASYTGTTLAWTSYLGGSDYDMIFSAAATSAGLLLYGNTYSMDFPVTDGGVLGNMTDSFLVLAALPSGAPVLATSPSDLTFTGASSQPATISNIGGGTLNWTASDDASWLSAAATSGSLAAGASQSVNLTVDPAGLAPGIYVGTFTVTDGSATSTVTAHLTVSAPPAMLEVTPSNLSFSAVEGGANPASQNITISNTGGSPLSWSATDDAAWLGVASPSGSLGAGASTNNAATASITGLAPGTYTGTIQVTDGPTTASVAVTLTVTPAPPPSSGGSGGGGKKGGGCGGSAGGTGSASLILVMLAAAAIRRR